jgi:uncharacterized protein (UPF0332 family)
LPEKEILSLIDKAKSSQEAANKLFDLGYSSFAVSRSYYAMLYATQALLLTKNLTFSKHSGVISAFGQHFVKAGLLPKELHAYLREAFDKRTKGDYALEEISKSEAKVIIDRAEEFIKQIGEFIKATK